MPSWLATKADAWVTQGQLSLPLPPLGGHVAIPKLFDQSHLQSRTVGVLGPRDGDSHICIQGGLVADLASLLLPHNLTGLPAESCFLLFWAA
jgi:hypothetical protein